MKEFLVSTGFSADHRIRGCPIPVGGVRRDIVADRMLLTGDAAGFVDAFIGEGLSFAIRSGQLAADAAADALRRGDCTAEGLRSYETHCSRAFMSDLRYALHFSRLMHLLPGLFLKMMASSDDVIDKYVEVVARRLSYAEFFAWLLPRVPFLLAKTR